ncbi:hypothetical protein SAMN05880582_105228 [Rhizobium sp. RU20A]|uniref:hypothetical protein n=1 Tax=Rhizobium sp. RU20A TaxID=1907412 RepID=UPI0009561F83|nr:hypothetical protein [Rhizobium sp. RU20A]SIR01675.1 hypothetical protein SAMN05880582_105228 [Rhizobium sp. RU20A]
MPKRKRKRGPSSLAIGRVSRLPMTPNQALGIRVKRALRKRIAPPPPVSEVVLVFRSEVFDRVIEAPKFYKIGESMIGVSNKKNVHPVYFSGEYIFIDFDKYKSVPKIDCSLMANAPKSADEFPKAASLQFKFLTDKIPSQSKSNFLKYLLLKHSKESNSVLRGRDIYRNCIKRWIRQAELSANMSAPESVRQNALAMIDVIEKEMKSLENEYFHWPSTSAPKASGRGFSIQSPDEGILSFFQYHVGFSSEVSQHARRAILLLIFKCDLPPILPPEHMMLWAAPNTSRRLYKIAHTLASLTRNAKRQKYEKYQEAISDWESDLGFLYRNLYVGHFKFDWPST